MRFLSTTNLDLVARVGYIADEATFGGALGGVAGVSYGMSVGATGTTTLGLAGIWTAAGAGLIASGAIGWPLENG